MNRHDGPKKSSVRAAATTLRMKMTAMTPEPSFSSTSSVTPLATSTSSSPARKLVPTLDGVELKTKMKPSHYYQVGSLEVSKTKSSSTLWSNNTSAVETTKDEKKNCHVVTKTIHIGTTTRDTVSKKSMRLLEKSSSSFSLSSSSSSSRPKLASRVAGLSPTIRKSIDTLVNDYNEDQRSIRFLKPTDPSSLLHLQRPRHKIDAKPKVQTSENEEEEKKFLLPRWTNASSFLHDDSDNDEGDDRDDETRMTDGDKESSWITEKILGRSIGILSSRKAMKNAAMLLSSCHHNDHHKLQELQQSLDRARFWCWETCVINKSISVASDLPNPPVDSYLRPKFFDRSFDDDNDYDDTAKGRHDLKSAFDKVPALLRSFKLPHRHTFVARVIDSCNKVTHVQFVVCYNCGKDIFDDGTVFSKTTIRKFKGGQDTYCENCVAEYVSKKRANALQFKKREAVSTNPQSPTKIENSLSSLSKAAAATSFHSNFAGTRRPSSHHGTTESPQSRKVEQESKVQKKKSRRERRNQYHRHDSA